MIFWKITMNINTQGRTLLGIALTDLGFVYLKMADGVHGLEVEVHRQLFSSSCHDKPSPGSNAS